MEKYLIVFRDGDEFIVDDYTLHGDSFSYFMNGRWVHGLEWRGPKDDAVVSVRPIKVDE